MEGNGSDLHQDKARRFRDAALPYLDDVFTLARYLLRNPADAEDAVAEASRLHPDVVLTGRHARNLAEVDLTRVDAEIGLVHPREVEEVLLTHPAVSLAAVLLPSCASIVTRRVPLDVTYEGHARDPWGGERAMFSAQTKVNREDFLKHYRGAELDPNWLDRVGRLPGKGWKVFVIKHPDDIAKTDAAMKMAPVAAHPVVVSWSRATLPPTTRSPPPRARS